MNWRVSKGCLFALFITATALYKLPYTIVFAFTPIYLTFLDRFCQNCLNNNLMCYMQIFLCLSSTLTCIQCSSLTANCIEIHHAVSPHKGCCFAFRQKRFDFLKCHPETQEIERGGVGKALPLQHLQTIVSLGIHHTPHLGSLLHPHSQLSVTLEKEPEKTELRNAKLVNKVVFWLLTTLPS